MHRNGMVSGFRSNGSHFSESEEAGLLSNNGNGAVGYYGSSYPPINRTDDFSITLLIDENWKGCVKEEGFQPSPFVVYSQELKAGWEKIPEELKEKSKDRIYFTLCERTHILNCILTKVRDNHGKMGAAELYCWIFFFKNSQFIDRENYVRKLSKLALKAHRDGRHRGFTEDMEQDCRKNYHPRCCIM